MHHNITVRKSIPDDIYEIREVEKITWLNTYPNEKAGVTLEDIESRFKNDDTPEGKQKIEKKKSKYNNKDIQTWVAVENTKVIGFCVAGKENGKDRILAIYVLPQYQGKKIGNALITEALNWMGNGKKAYINVVEYNINAIGFYKKHGFTETGVKGVFDSAAMLPSGKLMTEIELVKSL